eukprot:1684714-Rhodomonas_salina.1
MQIKLYRSENVKWVKMFYPASVSYCQYWDRNANSIVPKYKCQMGKTVLSCLAWKCKTLLYPGRPSLLYAYL